MAGFYPRPRDKNRADRITAAGKTGCGAFVKNNGDIGSSLYYTRRMRLSGAGWIPVACAVLGWGGCATQTYEPRVAPRAPDGHRRVIKPVVAVTDFENRASFSGQWNLGSGFADVLSTELLKTKRVVVLERRNLGDVVSEIARQGTELFRPEGRVDRGQLRNARYLLRGVVTDFTVTGDASGWFGGSTVRSWFGGSSARVSLNIKVSAVETGEIIGSVRTEDNAHSGFFGAGANYKKLSFGGDAFFRTPLGEATEGAIRRAVKQLMETIPTEYWTPQVAEILDGAPVINGGENVELQVGEEFVAREPPRTIRDPITGDVIEALPGKVLGRIRVTEVRPSSATAEILEGTVRKNSTLESSGRENHSRATPRAPVTAPVSSGADTVRPARRRD